MQPSRAYLEIVTQLENLNDIELASLSDLIDIQRAKNAKKLTREEMIAADQNSIYQGGFEQTMQIGIDPAREGEDYSISLCPHCFCMTKTIDGHCGKCGLFKDD